MTATRYDFNLFQGKDLDFTVQVWANDQQTIPDDITGWEARMMIRSFRDDIGSPLVSLTSNPADGLTVDGPAGQVTVHVDGTTTTGYTWLNGQYDIEIFQGNSVRGIAYGNVSITTEVTR